MNQESAHFRHLRIVSTATGLGSIIFVLLAVPAIIDQLPVMVWPFFPIVTVLFCVLPALLIPAARFGSIRLLRGIAAAHTVVTGVLIVAWLPSMLTARVPGDQSPFVLNTMAIVAATAVIGWRAPVAWVVTLACSVGGGVLRFVVLGDGPWEVPLQDTVSMVSFGTIVAALLLVTLSVGRELDSAQALAERDAATAAEAESRSRQRARFGSFVHDDVITTLLAASRATTRSEALERTAGNALRRLDRFVASNHDHRASTPGALEVEIRSVATEVVGGIRFSGSLAAFEGLIPSSVELALTGAVGEAVRNSARHAADDGVDVTREIIFSATSASIGIEIADDGRGFDPAKVSRERLGIRISILDRMTEVPGSSVDVVSSPGHGARVRLGWSG